MLGSAKIFFAIFFLILTVFPYEALPAAGTEQVKATITRTAKVRFFRNKTGNLAALIIPYTLEGSYPRSGWITCDVIDKKIAEVYAAKIGSGGQFEGYFTATYKKTEENKTSPILHYKGELLKLEPWSPPFAGKK